MLFMSVLKSDHERQLFKLHDQEGNWETNAHFLKKPTCTDIANSTAEAASCVKRDQQYIRPELRRNVFSRTFSALSPRLLITILYVLTLSGSARKHCI